MKTRLGKVPFDNLTEQEKETIYQECEQVRPEDGAPLSAEDKQLHRRAGLRVGRPRISSRGARRINISMERGLLESADRAARKRGITRARLIADSVRAYLAGAA
jgi:hypothetical protein